MKMKASFPAGLANAALAIKGMALALVLAGVATAVQADPLSTYDEGMSALLIMDECKVDFSDLNKKYPSPEPRLRAMGDAAWHQLWDALDQEDGAHHDENARKADFELKKRSEADLARAKALVSSKGCDALVPDARKVLESYLQ